MTTLLLSTFILMAQPATRPNKTPAVPTHPRVELYAEKQRRLAQNRFDLSFGWVEV